MDRMTRVRALEWDDTALLLLDQRLLPGRVAWVRCSTPQEVASAIGSLVVRGAPAIGVAAGYGMVTAALRDSGDEALEAAARHLMEARPTAVNLAWAVDRVLARMLEVQPSARAESGLDEARRIQEEDAGACIDMARHGADLVPGEEPAEILTHCNAGALATTGIGTALGVVRELAARGRLARLWACEARPVLQGARLTAWEAAQDGLPLTLVSDSAAATVLASRRLKAVFVGADRIAADGSTANKIGTYPLAVLARRHGVPFYVVAPTSTVDLGVPDGTGIPVEERGPDEVRRVRGVLVAPPETTVFNPAFDVTPPELITAIVTELGVARPPLGDALARLLESER